MSVCTMPQWVCRKTRPRSASRAIARTSPNGAPVFYSILVYIHTRMIHTYIDTFKRIYIYTYVQTYIHTCIHTYTHTYIHTYIHTNILRHPFVLAMAQELQQHRGLDSTFVASWQSQYLCSGDGAQRFSQQHRGLDSTSVAQWLSQYLCSGDGAQRFSQQHRGLDSTFVAQ